MTSTPRRGAVPASHVDVAWPMRHRDDPALVLLDASIARRVDADGNGAYGSGQDLFRSGRPGVATGAALAFS